MTREQIKQIVRLTEAIVNKRLNESVSNTLEGIIEKRAYEELKSIMSDKDINILSKLINKIDVRAENSKDYDGNEFFDHVENLSGYFPIDTVKDLFAYLNEYISTIDANMVNPPLKVTAAIKQIIKNTKLTKSIVNKRLNENGSYYRTEFSKISAAPGPTQPKIQIMDEHAKTKWIDLNNESVPELIGWLQRTF